MGSEELKKAGKSSTGIQSLDDVNITLIQLYRCIRSVEVSAVAVQPSDWMLQEKQTLGDTLSYNYWSSLWTAQAKWSWICQYHFCLTFNLLVSTYVELGGRLKVSRRQCSFSTSTG